MFAPVTSYTKNPLSGWITAATAEEFEPAPPALIAFMAFVVASLRVVCIFDLNASSIGLNSDIEPVQFWFYEPKYGFCCSLFRVMVLLGWAIVLLLLLGDIIKAKAVAMLDNPSK